MREFLAESFDQTLKKYKITGKRLADASGASPSQISEFRSGKRTLNSALLERVMLAMDQLEPGSRRYFCTLLAGGELENINTFEIAKQVELLNSKQLAALLNSVADRLATAQSRELAGTLT